jgi:hypothetical protein
MRFAKIASTLSCINCWLFFFQLVAKTGTNNLSRDFFNRFKKKLHLSAVVFFEEQFLLIRTSCLD